MRTWQGFCKKSYYRRLTAYGIWKKGIASRLSESATGKKSKAKGMDVKGGQRHAQDLLQVNNLFVCLFDAEFPSFVLLAEGCRRVGHFGLYNDVRDELREKRESEM